MEAKSDADLPAGIASVLPADPYDQLEIAHRIMSKAIASRADELGTSAKLLMGQIEDRDASIAQLEQRVAELRLAVEQNDAKLSTVLAHQSKLRAEKSNLEATVKKLTKDVAKLETFKRTLIHSLQEDDSSKAQNLKLPLPSSSSSAAAAATTTPSSSSSSSDTAVGSPGKSSSSPTAARLAAASPKGKPTKSFSKWHSMGSMSSISLPSSNHSTAPNSPPHIGQQPGATPRMDGKEFFRKTRNRLSYEQFNDFLANVKELNAHHQTKEETLKKVQEIFGPENEDLFSIFNSLLLRHRPSHDD